ncbi:MAG: tRNA lysidine(34) synthetase TilS, partial [Mariprofundus sp.]|nr:tRNA lysidine(34) synthetase TilS [Mariprofundus sp.]
MAEDTPHLPDTLAVGWSGGADSTALLLALKASGRKVHAWHIDHGWRTSSADEALALAEQAKQWNIPFISARLEPASKKNRENEARQGRYGQFQLWSREQAIGTLCLGHHRDDQAETVCMRLLQGAGAGGCRGMAAERRMGTMRIVRPLLHISGHALRQALQDLGMAWLD